MKCPSRQQWRVLAALRSGPATRMQRAGRTGQSCRRRGWVAYDGFSTLPYRLTADGLDALALGDRRYRAAEDAYARRPL